MRDFFDHYDYDVKAHDANGEIPFDEVHLLTAEQKKRLWTMVDDDDGGLALLAGYHVVNRIAYRLSTKPWKSKKESFKIS